MTLPPPRGDQSRLFHQSNSKPRRPERPRQKARYAPSRAAILAESVARYDPTLKLIPPPRAHTGSPLPLLFQKCDERPNAEGRCETCIRLRLQCLGFGQKRPDWLKVRALCPSCTSCELSISYVSFLPKRRTIMSPCSVRRSKIFWQPRA
jgi:hypothetical protein